MPKKRKPKKRAKPRLRSKHSKPQLAHGKPKASAQQRQATQGDDSNRTDSAKLTLIAIRDQHQPRSNAIKIDQPDARTALRAALEMSVQDLQYPIVEIREGAITFLDADTHHWPSKPSAEELDAHIAAMSPVPDCCWRTHGAGIRAVFIGPGHEEAAEAAALSLPKSFEVEIKRDTRHPNGPHPSYPGIQAGLVYWNDQPRPECVDWLKVGWPDPANVDEALAKLGLVRGRRYDHDKCPIDGRSPCDAKGCVFVGDAGVICFRCRAKGVNLDGIAAPGFVPVSRLGTGSCMSSPVVQLARGFVHWSHAKIQLQQEHANISGPLLRRIYQRVVEATHQPNDPRVKQVFNRDLGFVFTTNGPMDSTTWQPLQLSDDSFNALPAICNWRPRRAEENKKSKIEVRKPLRDRLRNGLLPAGYRAIRVVRGISFKNIEDEIVVTIPPPSGDPIQLIEGEQLVPEREAFESLACAFPQISVTYIKAAVAAAICAEHGGRRPILFAVGPTGSGKGETLRLAASFLGDARCDLTLKDEEPMRRQVGAAVAAGHRFLFIDELLRR